MYWDEDLPFKIKNEKYYIDWDNSIGKYVRFKYNEFNGKVYIKDYYKENRKVTNEYENTTCDIKLESFKNCNLRSLFSKVFLYKDNDIVNNFLIKNHFYKKSNSKKYNIKYYSYKCLKCGWDKGEISESNLKLGKGCSCCSSRIVVQGINDICTTDPWMIPYFQGGEEEAKLYTSNSNKMIYPICPYCGRIKDKPMKISRIKIEKSIGCHCSKTTSYPNKFIFNMLEQLNISFTSEKVFDWAKFAKYDFVLNYPINNQKYIIEADGNLGHGNYTMTLDENDRMYSLYCDYRKDTIANKHGYEVIRIDCKKSDIEYIKNNIINSKLDKIINLKNVDWNECEKFAMGSEIKEICDLYKNGKSIDYLSKKYQHTKETIRKYLNKGNNFGWCNYDSKRDSIAALERNRGSNHRVILIYDSNFNFLKKVRSIASLVRNSNEIIGISISKSSIIHACKTGKICKGFYFRYEE